MIRYMYTKLRLKEALRWGKHMNPVKGTHDIEKNIYIYIFNTCLSVQLMIHKCNIEYIMLYTYMKKKYIYNFYLGLHTYLYDLYIIYM